MNTNTMVRPTSDRIIVRRNQTKDVTDGGIVLPETAKDKSMRGTVVAVGPGLLLNDGHRSPMETCEGNSIVFSAYGGTEIEFRGETLLVMRESEVLFIE